MEQSRAINALAPFLALSKSATSARAAADLVTQATSATHTYVFGELLQTPNIQSLRDDAQYRNHYTLLELFAWGTWAEYQTLASTLPSLSAVQQHKLQLLTLLTLAANTTPTTPLTYANLQSALSLDSPLALERLVTDAIYADLLTATLNPAQGIVAISSVAALRDLNPGSVTRMMASLDTWSNTCDDVLKELEAQMKSVMDAAEKRSHEEAVRAEQVQRAEGLPGKDQVVEIDAMEVDDGGQKS
ncbi:hypothetical protein M436DRAFT_13631, partial [Aureobasidium namibiae CBS 147.97]